MSAAERYLSSRRLSLAVLAAFLGLAAGLSCLASAEGRAGDPQETKGAPPKQGPFLRITCLDERVGPVVFRFGAARPEQRRRNFHLIRVLGHLSTVFTPAPKGPSPWDFRPELTSSVEPVKKQAPAPGQAASSDVRLDDGDVGDSELEVEVEELGDRKKLKRHVERDADGKPKWEAYYKDGVAEGNYTVWHPNGRKKLKGQFRHNLWHGAFTEWDEKGRIVSVREFRDGLQVKLIKYEGGKPAVQKIEVLDFKYDYAQMLRGYLPVPVPPPEEDWRQTTEACRPARLLPPGKRSAAVDLSALLPYGETRYHLYVRAYHRSGLCAVRAPIRLDLFEDKERDTPLTSVETHSGFLGVLLSGMGTDRPLLETIEMWDERLRRETKEILAKREGRDIFVAPDGRPDGKGIRESPLDLQSALYPKGREGAAQPGDTIWLLGGVYRAPGWLTQKARDRIERMKRTAKPKDLPKVKTLGLEEELTEEAIEKELSEPKEEEPPPGDHPTEWLTQPPNEIQPFLDYHFRSDLTGEPDNPIIVRQLPGEDALLSGGIHVGGSHTWFWGFEITEPPERANTTRAHPSINSTSPGVRLINLRVHRGSAGINFWSASNDGEMYGCIIHDFGYGGSRGHGHAMYTQNETGHKRIIDNIMFHGFGWNFHAYTEGGEVFNYYLEGNVSFSAGMKKGGQVTDNWLIMTRVPAHRMYLVGNLGYHPLAFSRGVRFNAWGYDTELVLRRNLFYGSTQAMAVGRWRSVECVGNRLWARRRLVNAIPKDPARHPDAYLWDQNTYVLPRDSKPFNYRGDRCDFERWKEQSGFDGQSQVQEGKDGRPSGTEAVIRPNFYEPGRAHVAVLNWDGLGSVPVDFGSFLEKGQRYAVHHVLDLEQHGLRKPVLTATFDGRPVSLPCRKSKVSPDLEVFLVLPDPD